MPDELRSKLKQAAHATGRSEADLIREGVELASDRYRPGPKPKLPLFSSADPLLTDPDRLDEAMEGHGEG